jgi:hypothetical protein
MYQGAFIYNILFVSTVLLPCLRTLSKEWFFTSACNIPSFSASDFILFVIFYGKSTGLAYCCMWLKNMEQEALASLTTFFLFCKQLFF